MRTAGDEYAAAVLVWATGSLSEPSIPEFPGPRRLPRQGLPLGPVGARVRSDGQARVRRRHRRLGHPVRAADRPGRRAPVPAPTDATIVVPRGDRAVSRLRKLAYRKVPALQRLSGCASTPCSRPCSAFSSATADRRKAPSAKRALDHLAKQVPDEALRAEADAALRARLQAPPALRRLLPLAHPPQRGGGGRTGGLVHPARSGGPGRHRPPGRRRHHGHRIRGRRASLRGAHRRPRGHPVVRAVEGGRRGGVRRLHRGGLSEPLPHDRAELDVGPQLHDLHDRVAHQLHRQRVGVHARGPACGPWRSSGASSGATTSGCRRNSSIRCGSRAGAAAGIWTTAAATRRCGPTTPGSSAG